MLSEGDNHVPPVVTATATATDLKGYALSGKIMLSAIIILFLVVVLMVSLHLYARWYLLRQRRRQQLLRRRRSRLDGGSRRAHIVFYVDSNNPNVLVSGADDPANRGLEPAVLRSLPVFVYSSKAHSEGLECAVCLSEFEEDEKGRILPKCNHSFHTECIDMWFQSHSTCPICRAAVEPVQEPDNSASLKVEPGGSSSGLCVACQHDDDGASGSSSTPPLGSRRKGMDLTGVTIEVPRRGTGLDDELPLSSPASYGFRSPGSRLLSLKRILSMGRKTPTGSSTAGTSRSPAAAATMTELDLESGTAAAEPSRIPTPR